MWTALTCSMIVKKCKIGKGSTDQCVRINCKILLKILFETITLYIEALSIPLMQATCEESKLLTSSSLLVNLDISLRWLHYSLKICFNYSMRNHSVCVFFHSNFHNSLVRLILFLCVCMCISQSYDIWPGLASSLTLYSICHKSIQLSIAIEISKAPQFTPL